MASGKNKNIAINTVIALLEVVIVILVHQFGYDWYMSHFSPRSRGGTLGFVMFYMRYVVTPVVFLSAFIRIKYSLLAIGMVIIYMIYTWYSTNPLRVILMFCSCSIGYIVVIICSIVKKYL